MMKIVHFAILLVALVCFELPMKIHANGMMMIRKRRSENKMMDETKKQKIARSSHLLLQHQKKDLDAKIHEEEEVEVMTFWRDLLNNDGGSFSLMMSMPTSSPNEEPTDSGEPSFSPTTIPAPTEIPTDSGEPSFSPTDGPPPTEIPTDSGEPSFSPTSSPSSEPIE